MNIDESVLTTNEFNKKEKKEKKYSASTLLISPHLWQSKIVVTNIWSNKAQNNTIKEIEMKYNH